MKRRELEGFKEGEKERDMGRCTSETVEQGEEGLSRRIRDRARREAIALSVTNGCKFTIYG